MDSDNCAGNTRRLKILSEISNIERNVNAILEVSNEDSDSAEASETENGK